MLFCNKEASHRVVQVDFLKGLLIFIFSLNCDVWICLYFYSGLGEMSQTFYIANADCQTLKSS